MHEALRLVRRVWLEGHKGALEFLSPPSFCYLIPFLFFEVVQYPLLNMVLGLSDLLPKMCALVVNMALT